MFIVKKKKGESDDSLLGRFRKKTVSTGIISEVKERAAYEKPSQKRKKKKYQHKFERKLAKQRSY